MRFPRISFGHLLLVVQAAVIVVLIVWNLKEDATIEVIKEETPAQPIPEAPVTPHAEAIQHIDDDASMALSRVAQLIIRDEGERSRPYLDASGHVTIGVGRNLQSNGLSVSELHSIVPAVDYMHVLRHAQVSGGRIRAGSLEVANRLFPQPLTEDDIMLLLTDDLNVVRKQAQSVFGANWLQIDAIRREAIVDVLFNLGLPHFKEFTKFIAAVNARKWNDAAAELLLSKAARENITRYHRAAAVIQTGNERYFDLK